MEKNIRRSSLNELPAQALNTAGVLRTLCGTVNVRPLVITRGKAPKAPTILRYFKLENS